MKLASPQAYSLQLFDEGPYGLSVDGAICKFSRPASASKHPKLYTLAVAGKLVYVGGASQSMSARLSLGFRANGKGGYHGYKWKNLRNVLSLNVWSAEHDGRPATLRDFETVEAEVAFLCRRESGQWPEFQHEIHFYRSLPRHRDAATEIYLHAVRAE